MTKIESVSYLDGLFELSPDALVLVDGGGEIVRINRVLENLFGYKPDDLIGQKVEAIIPERYRKNHPSQREGYSKDPHTRQMGAGLDLSGLRKDGTEFAVDIMLSPINVAGKNFVLASIRDISERKKIDDDLKIALAKFQSIFDHTYQFIGLLSPDGTLLEVNKTATSFIDVELEDVLNKPFWETPWWSWSKQSQAHLKESIDKASAGEFVRYETSHPNKNGKLVTFDFSLKPIKDNEDNVVVVIAEGRDITEQKMAERQREDFVATLTHDLKTPILAANRALNLLVEGDFGSVDDSQKEIIETILESNDSMYQMVLTLLDVYKYDSGAKKLNLMPTDITEVANKLIDELKPLATSKQIDLKSNAQVNLMPVIVDKDEVRRLIQNLLDNSLKYTTNNQAIEVQISQDDDFTTVSVIDTGKGISDEDKPKLFQRFWQAASTGGRYYASTGLGLYLCRQIAESHGGRIWCESELGKGSKFSFTLPNIG